MSAVVFHEYPARVVVYDTNGVERLSAKWEGVIGGAWLTAREAFTVGRAEWHAADGALLHVLDGSGFDNRNISVGQEVAVTISGLLDEAARQ
jgi:hypothetical protein